MSRPCIAVVSPFIDKRHGTERRVAEWVSRLADHYEVHVYSNRVEDVDLGKVIWHRIPRLPGPHLLAYLWWFAANHLWRWRDRTFRGLRYDLVFSPGINCLDADIISVHIVFAEFYRQVRAELSLRRNPVKFWLRLLHRRLYYGLIQFLERRIYPDPRTTLVLIARKTAEDLKRFYGRGDNFLVVYIGLDQEIFNPAARQRLRQQARDQLGLSDDAFVFLLVGNDWKKKGLACLIEAIARLHDSSVCLLVAGKDDPHPYRAQLRGAGLNSQVRFLPSRPDVIFYYAAADAYVGPSLEDTFAQPPAEAMACGLPVITSAANGTAEIITDGVDGLIVRDATDVGELVNRLRLIRTDPELRQRLGERAAQTARHYTWDRNGVELREIFEQVLAGKQATG
jgi:glycosyltransferase involved in cell wall biosynthesis